MNCWQKFPKDLTFFFLDTFFEFLLAPGPFFKPVPTFLSSISSSESMTKSKSKNKGEDKIWMFDFGFITSSCLTEVQIFFYLK